MTRGRYINIILLMMITLSTHAITQDKMNEEKPQESPSTINLEKATLGAGCFWCVETIYQDLEGVHEEVSGYCGGDDKTPTYKEVCTGSTGHAEVCQIIFDPQKISYSDILQVYWKIHDPTTLNRQGNDVGTQYRSVIFYHNDQQKELAESYKKQLDESGAWDKPLVTVIEPFENFYPAEQYHQDYYSRNPEQPYCSMVIRPKIEKFRKVFKDKLK